MKAKEAACCVELPSSLPVPLPRLLGRKVLLSRVTFSLAHHIAVVPPFNAFHGNYTSTYKKTS